MHITAIALKSLWRGGKKCLYREECNGSSRRANTLQIEAKYCNNRRL